PEELDMALAALVDHAIPGRSGEIRPANAKELAATAVIRLELDEVSAKTREDGANDDPEDADLPHWSGLIPVTTVHGTPVPFDESVPLPAHLHGYPR
ncbi:pyridoxamine 5'-phosphate oxidase family protein, partial [Kitasatospora sp. NPDC058190]|uniref:pyridoxamine 5'-phosphate oxidase family protein n=1 Tax=Kitasatospora sp. NPDC058190 TaxID=3346371 RepID=UPI0036D97F2A